MNYNTAYAAARKTCPPSTFCPEHTFELCDTRHALRPPHVIFRRAAPLAINYYGIYNRFAFGANATARSSRG